LLEQGHQCEIWSFRLQYPNFLFPGTSQFTHAPAPKGISIRSVINSINPLNWLRTGWQLRQRKPDLIIVRYWIPFMGPCLGTILRLAKLNSHSRIVCIADNVIPHEKRPGDRLFTSYFTGAPHAFVVMSKEVMQDLRQFTQKQAVLLPHPLYDNFGEKVLQPEARLFLSKTKGIGLAPDARLLVFFGLIRPYKGLDLLLEAMALLPQHAGVKLLVAGEFYEDPQPYRDLITRYQLEQQVWLHGQFIAEDEVKYFIGAADCIIQPYKTATQSGVTPVAYHFEKPMIVTRVGGLPQMVPHGEAGLVCEPSAPAIAAAITEFFSQPTNRFTKGLLAQKKLLSWESFTEGMLQVAGGV
jgi:glycosyltransferase involved in cell wall biosynthesis